MTRILVAEDEERIVAFLRRGFESNGFSVAAVGNGIVAAEMARDSEFDLMILDLGLPGIEGHEVLRRVRGRGERLPIIVLTARDSVDATVGSFDVGADDHVTKPFRFEELLARVRARIKPEAVSSAGERATTTLVAGDVTLDLLTRQAHVAGRTVDLSAREFALAETLMRRPGQVFSREQLLSRVWGYDFSPESNVVDVYVRYLRKKLGHDAVETVRGMGYRVPGPRSPTLS
jgi:DNA-binding response OmpR family regulator